MEAYLGRTHTFLTEEEEEALTLEVAQNSQMSDTRIAIWIAGGDDYRSHGLRKKTHGVRYTTKGNQQKTLNENVTKLEEIHGYTELEKMVALLPSANRNLRKHKKGMNWKSRGYI